VSLAVALSLIPRADGNGHKQPQPISATPTLTVSAMRYGNAQFKDAMDGSTFCGQVARPVAANAV